MRLRLYRSKYSRLLTFAFRNAGFAGVLLFVTCLFTQAQADTLWLENGDVISGEIVGLDTGNLTFKTTYAGEITVSWRHVRTLKTDSPLWVNLVGENKARLRELHSDGDEFIIVDPGGKERHFSAAWPIASIAQSEPVLEDNWDLGGRVGLNLESRDGNDIESRYRMDGELNINDQWNKNRLKWKVDVERKDEGVWKKNEWEVEYNYSRYFSEHWFTNASAKKRYHSRENLRSRTNMGGFYGYRFRETTSEALLTSLGLSQINEKYDREGNLSNIAIGWKMYHRRFLFDDLEYFLDSSLYYRIQSRQQWIWEGEHGLRYKITKNMSFNITQNLDYDSLPGEGEKRMDSLVKFGLGYNW